MNQWFKTKATTSLSDRVFILTGKAGTGKTTLAKYMLETFINPEKVYNTYEAYSHPDIIGVAMAHKAKEVLRGSIPDVATFASYFNFKAKYLDNGTIIFEKSYWDKNKKRICDLPFLYVIHDEVSMYSEQMKDILLEDTNPKSKIILMGE